jgi:hypothetical protein
MRDHEELDRLIDAALTSYASPETGVEARVLARIAEARRSRQVRGWLIAGSGLALAASILLLFGFNTRLAHTPVTTNQTERLAAAAPAIAVKPVPHLASPTEPRRRAAAEHLRTGTRLPGIPKLAVFPTPAPLSAEERALVRLATETTSEERKNLLEARQQAAEPLHIASISIPPIEPPAEGKE